MPLRTPVARWSARGGTAAFAGLALAASMQAGLTGTHTLTAGPPAVQNPYSPAYHHPYRRGVVPSIPQLEKMRRWARNHPGATGIHQAAASDLNYGGGIGGIGVTTGHEKVYLVFYGSQWGTQSTNGNGDITLTGDPSGEAPYLQELFKGLGAGGERWSGVMTQYCDGVSVGAQSCPASSTQHVAYPTGGALAGVWVDKSTASPLQATAAQLGAEAVRAAGHFGNTTAGSNRNAQYVILSPTGTHPDGFNTSTGQFCAWHDWNGDPYVGVNSPYGDIAFTNSPYVTDMGANCGAGFVNSGAAGARDGISIIGGHEYAETVTDQNPAGGWTDSTGNENGDKCAWIPAGSSGGAGNLSLATGTFAMQSTWANDGSGGAGACEFSHSIVVDGGGNTVTVNSPGSQTETAGVALSLQITATDSASGQTLSYTATGLPAGLSINSSTGIISGKPTTAASYHPTVTATDTTAASGSTSFTWTISATGGGGITNGGFETGTFSGWTRSGAATSIVSAGQHSGSFAARAGAASPTNGTSNIVQTFTAKGSKLSLSYDVVCPDSVTFDWATIILKDNTTATTYTVLPRTCVADSGWKLVTHSLTAGHSYTLTLRNRDDNHPGDPTYTLFDDVGVS